MSKARSPDAGALARRLTGDDVRRAQRALMRRDPALGALIKRVGPCGLVDPRPHDPFADLVRVILSQQLSTKAADTIFRRVAALADGVHDLTGARLLRVDADALRAAGVSRPKISYLHDLAARVGDGRLDLAAFDALPDEDVIASITAVKGLGRWSADMYLMFRLNRPDVLPVGDLGIVRGFQKLYGMRRPPAERTMVRLAERWRPWRSIGCWYLWRLHD